MSTRSFADGRKLIGKKTSAKGRLDAAILAGMEPLEQRQLLNAQVLPQNFSIPNPTGSTPLPAKPGQTFYVNAQGSSNAWQWSSAITPNTVNDLVLNVTAYASTYQACCEGSGGPIGNTVSATQLMTNGLTQNQVGGFPATGAVAAIGSGNNSDASSGASVLSSFNGAWYLEYNLGTAPGQTASSTGYDLNEIDVIAGHQDFRTGMQDDIQVQYVGGNATDWFSLSNNNNFNFTSPGRGSAQMAIQSPGGPMAQNVRAVKFVAANNNTWFRELVVTGLPSANLPNGVNAPGTPSAVQDVTPGAIDVVFATSPGGAQSYAVQRALVNNGTPGGFTTIGGLVTTNNPTTFVDTTSAAGSVYTYRIVATNGTTTATSGNSNFFTTPPISAEAHYYNMAYWEGPATVNQGVAIVQLNWPRGSQAPGIRGSVNSAVITGKITPTVTGTYTLYSNTDDDGYLYVNGVLVSADPGGHGQRNAGSAVDINNNPIGYAKPVTLTAGTSYNFVLLEHNSGGGAGANLVWKTPDGTLQVVPAANLSPISDAPTAPTNLVMDSSTLNSNFVNFTFTGENNAVVHYILQRALASAPTVWNTVSQIDPGSDNYTGNQSLTVSPANAHQFMTIQDASPIPGTSYLYRVAAVNFDGAAATPTTPATLTAQGDLTSPPTGTLTLGTAADSGATLTAGTYYVQYSWLNSAGGVTAASAESTIVTSGTGDITVALPPAPAGAVNANVYLSNASGAERFVGNANASQTLTVRGLPTTASSFAPTSNTAGLRAGTYFVAYTWAGDESTVTGESSYGSISNATRLLVTNEQTIVLSATNDILVNGFPAAPAGVGGVNVYIGTSSGSERFIGSTTPTGSLVINSLPSNNARVLPAAQVNNTAFVSSTVSANVPALSATNPAGVEIHAYNQELFRRTSLPQVVEASAVAQNGLAAEYIAQTTNQTYLGGLYAGPIDRNYTDIAPSAIPQPAPSSPDPTLFPDYNRIHTESFSQAYTGTLTPGVSGVYTIISNTDDDNMTWLDGTLISADPGGHGQQDTLFPSALYPGQPTRGSDTLVPVFLVAGQTYDLTMFMGNTGGGSGAHLKWVEPPAFGTPNTGVVVSGSNADQTGATLNINDPNNSFLNSSYNNYTIFITAGPGSGQAGLISNYNTQTKNFTVNVTTGGNQSLWRTIPTTASRFMISWVAAVPLKGFDAYPVSSAGGLSLHQDLPVQGTWSPLSGAVSLTTSASAAQNVTITQLSPTAGASLTWSDQGLGELWFEVQRSTDGVNFSTVGTTPMNFGTTFSDPSASNAYGSPTISYFYRVRGVNFDGAGPFSPIVNTKNNILIPAPQIIQAIQGAPGTIGMVFSGGSPLAGGLDVQYATLNGSTTGAFVDATPLGLPFNTFDYQVTGLVPTQQYVFQVRNLPGGNNINSSLFGNPIAFTPVGGVQEAFGSPGTYANPTPGTASGGFVGSGSVIGDVLVNTNASLTGAGVPSPATPSTPVLTTPVDMANPFIAISSVTSAADAPAPTDAGTFATSPQNLDLSGASSVFVEYTWVTANGETLPFSAPVSFSIPSNTGVLLTYAVPTAPAGFGITNANIYIGTSTAPSAELFKASVAPGTSTLITSFAAGGAKTVPTSSSTGVPAGTYFVQYAWQNSDGQTTAASPEQSFVLTNASNDLFLPIPTTGVPANATNFKLYVGTVTGGEKLATSVALSSNTTTLALRGIPLSSAASAPTTNTAGLPVGTYYLQYSWAGVLPNENSTNEGLSSPMTSVVISTAGQDVALAVPASPAGSGNANVYFGTSPSSIFILSQAAGGKTFLARKIPTGGNRPPIASPPTTGNATITSSADTVVAPTTTLTIQGTANDAASTIATGTYYVTYTWTGNGGETTASTEQTFTVDAGGPADVFIGVPAGPAGSGNANIYLGTAPGAEKFLQSAAGNNQAILKTLPATNAAAAPATSTVALPAGTYYVAYTWTSGNSLETAGSTEQTVVVAANSDLQVTPPAAPIGAGNARIYLGTAPGQEFYTGQSLGGTSTATIRTVPNLNSKIVPIINSQAARLTTPANALQITNNNGGQAGNAFNLGENLAGFTTSFDWVLEGNTSADGFGIVFTPDGRTYTGGSGGNMSYGGTSPSMQRSVAILFDTYDGNGTGRTGMGINGNTPGNGGAPGWIDMKTQSGVPTGVVVTNGSNIDRRYGDVFNATISYDNNAHIITEKVTDLTLKNRGVNNVFTTTYSIDLVATVGMPAAYVGFVGGTGGAQAEHDVLNWSWSNSTTIALDTITGTGGVDNITLTQDADHQHIDWTLNGNPQVYQETITSANGLTINGLGSNDVITLNYANGNPLPNKLNLSGVFTLNGLQGTSPLAGTTVDMKTSTVFIPYGSPAADPISLVKGYLTTGYNGGTWTGTAASGSILSSSAAADNLNQSLGYADSADVANPAGLPANTLEIRYTAIGDTNLDGTVALSDLSALLKSYGTGTQWDQGLLLYGTTSGLSDLSALLKHYGNTTASPSAVPAATPAATPAAAPAMTSSSTTGLSTNTSSVTLSSASSSSVNAADSGSTTHKKKTAPKKKHK